MLNSNLVFSDFVSTADLGFFTMEMTGNGESIVFCGGSKELNNIERQIKNGESVNRFKSYISK